MSETRHFILRHHGEIDTNRLMSMIARRDVAYIDADVFDFRGYPTSENATAKVNLDLVLASIISLRHVPRAWMSQRRAVAILPPKSTPQMEAALAQLRSFGLLCVVVVESDDEVLSARTMGAQLLDAPVLALE